ncbi:hypothetical protein LMH87_002507 [Akanthomyces muscarius]|uniref:Uncharacterized protein n=1 Tax=Akanthomyces muscarius TaxID=2231603 RepID=A0A9W8Q6Z1_AKAMU|nr:hypothetical protein LMH87_002507 [Akanthomyces muscarius]KAJ4148018.1 hypothetical protein LMH87_002507 [Akanthomyces muscarius]
MARFMADKAKPHHWAEPAATSSKFTMGRMSLVTSRSLVMRVILAILSPPLLPWAPKDKDDRILLYIDAKFMRLSLFALFCKPLVEDLATPTSPVVRLADHNRHAKGGGASSPDRALVQGAAKHLATATINRLTFPVQHGSLNSNIARPFEAANSGNCSHRHHGISNPFNATTNTKKLSVW